MLGFPKSTRAANAARLSFKDISHSNAHYYDERENGGGLQGVLEVGGG